jgi:hypothetical protein
MQVCQQRHGPDIIEAANGTRGKHEPSAGPSGYCLEHIAHHAAFTGLNQGPD